MSKAMPKQWKLMLKLIELILIFCEACKLVRPHVRSPSHMMHGFGMEYGYNDDGDDFSKLAEVFKKWYSTECNEDILLTFGIQERSEEDLKLYWRQEDELKKRQASKYNKFIVESAPVDEWQKYESDDEDDFYMNDEFEMDVNPYRKGSTKHGESNVERKPEDPNRYIGISDEPALINSLYGMELKNLTFHQKRFRDFLNQKVQERFARSKFESLVIVRSKIDLLKEKFKINSFNIEDMVDSAIMDQLSKANRFTDSLYASSQIEMLVKYLSDNKKLLQRYFAMLINEAFIRVEKNVNMLHDYTPKEKQFSSDFRNSSGYGSLADVTKSDAAKKYLILKVILYWPQFAQLYDLHFNQKKDILEKQTAEKFQGWVDLAFLKTIDNIIVGNEAPIYIRLMKTNNANFLNLLRKTGKAKQPIEFFQALINTRSLEIDEFESYYKALGKFINLCRKYNNICNLKIYEEALEKLYKQIDGDLYILKPLNLFVKTRNINELQSKLEYKPIVTYFQGIDAAVMSQIVKINSLQRNKCALFDEYFLEECKNMYEKGNKQAININIIINMVLPKTLQNWKAIADSIESGEIKLNEIDKHLQFYKTKEKMLGEFEYICNYFGKNSFNLRGEQVNLYFRFQTSVQGAKQIDMIRRQLKMQSAFEELSPLLKISSEESKNWNLLKMNDQVRKTVDILAKLNSEAKLNCLEAFVNSHELVEWLRKNTVDIMGLKFLVELASASTNEPNADRDLLARALKDAGTAFAPLIYDLKLNDDFQKFMSHCEKVWHFLEEDSHVSEKLLEIRNKIEQLKEIKEKGNVEVSSIKQAKMFNEKGVYKVSMANDGSLKDLKRIEDIIFMEVEELDREKKLQKKTYNYNQLKDQQNILMLMAKKTSISIVGEEDDETKTLDYFLEIFDGITRLADLYLKLIRNGCILFNKFEAIVYCDFQNERHQSTKMSVCSISFQVGEHNKLDDLNSTTKQSLADLCSFLENCLKLWQEYVVNLREKHHCLNYLTINQIVYLREKLAKMFSIFQADANKRQTSVLDAQVMAQIKWLLMNINKNVTTELIMKAYKESEKFLAKCNPQIKLAGYDDKIKEFINRFASNNNFPQMLVKRAVDQHGIADDSKILSYCMEHENDELVETDVQNVVRKPLANNFKQLLQNSWTDFMIGKSSVLNNYISIEQLAYTLEQLRHEDIHQSEQFTRNVPGYLTHKGHPNLILCPIAEQMSTVLSIYAESGVRCPLPTNDECLFCTSETSGEEVEIFLRIALKSDGKKIYTLLNIQELNYEAANHAERCFTKINSSSNYIFVIMCSSEKQSQSILVSTFFKYKIHQYIPRTIGEIQKYMKFQLENQIKDLRMASFVLDPEKISVRTLLSDRPGAGKTLYVQSILNKPENNLNGQPKFGYKLTTIKTPKLSLDTQIEILLEYLKKSTSPASSHLYHIDVAYEVYEGVDQFLFNLTVLGYLKHSNGQLWRRSPSDLYLIEIMPPMVRTHSERTDKIPFHCILNYLPKIFFRQPKNYLYDLENNIQNEQHDYKNDTRFKSISIFDKNFTHKFTNDEYQCTCYYLKLLHDQSNELNSFRYYDNKSKIAVLTETECLKILLVKSGLKNPTWAELNNFVSFLSENLKDSEQSPFLGTALAPELGALKGIFLRLIIYMSYDFALPSLNIAEESPTSDRMDIDNDIVSTNVDTNAFDLNKMKIERHWERLSHPYILFNADHTTFTFMGLYLDRRKYEFLDTNTDKPIADFQTNQFKIEPALRMQLLTQRVPIFRSFNKDYQRKDRIEALRNVMGLKERSQNYDPDPSYELTLDNCLKMMAIYLRFRCNIPVMIMGETGCGKTRLIKYLCDLHLHQDIKNLKILMHVKVHGGTTAEIIRKKLDEASILAQENYRTLYSRKNFKLMKTGDIPASCVLFFDEANTTEAIGLIKEIMCDSSCNGFKIDFNYGLKIIAACNPYKKHSDEMIMKLEQAGLGFYKSANDTKEKLGHIPMRQLVYRVQPLPGSFLPLVWDFGQLNNEVEQVYIKQMLRKAIDDKRILIPSNDEKEINLLSELLTTSQAFMRDRKDECSFVSLRDIERVIKVASWFSTKKDLIFQRMDKRVIKDYNDQYQEQLTPIRRSFVLALVVCYHNSLQDPHTRKAYRNLIERKIQIDQKFLTESSIDWIYVEILKIENVFLDEIELNKNIARNNALLENVFMMTICVELRIPLFLVGKPGSSKSLAKTIVANAMQGKNSKSELYKNLKEAYFVNFQCSPLTTPEMIVKAFKEAANFQKGKNLEVSVAVVNLDEIGLAEASESMPLKTLHPLLEEGNDTDQESKDYEKVGVIGISNWALDPAKMNRGIFVCRSEPSINELVESAKGICNYDQHIFRNIEPHVRDISESYLKLCEFARETKREFFGLRDFYSLIKMIYWFCSKDTNNLFTWNKLEHAVKRNFSGLDFNPIKSFEILKTKAVNPIDQTQLESDPKSNPIDLVQSALRGDNIESNNRYLLLLTENYAILDIIQNYLLNIVKIENHNLITIFGSSFRNDQQYTEVCRNISRIKHSMEIGNTVILLNFDNLYESLYDALNQYYHTFAGQKFVDLGLGTHRVKCSVHDSFRLIVIAEKSSVYDTKRFPIPLINRLEKHYLSATTMLKKEQEKIVNKIKEWVDKFCFHSQNSSSEKKQVQNDVFIGFHDDAIATIVLYLDQERNKDDKEEDETSINRLIETSKSMLLQCATSDSIARLSSIKQIDKDLNKELIWNEYFIKQKHTSLKDMIKYHLNNKKQSTSSKQQQQFQLNRHLLQITTNSKLLITKTDLARMAVSLGEKDANKIKENFSSCMLNAFDTQQQFINRLREFLFSSSSAALTCSSANDAENDPYAMNVDSSENDVLPSNASKLRLFIIQIDLTRDTRHIFDLISCTRHVIVEECKNAIKNKRISNTFICLVINIPRENCSQFIGFQVNYWSCYHVDDIDEPPNDIPTFDLLKDKSLSVLLDDSLKHFNNKEHEISNDYIDLKLLLHKCAYYACSFIKDDNLKRTIERIDIFIRLCKNNHQFLELITKYVIDLQKEKEVYSSRLGNTQNWFIGEVAKLDNIKKYSTLRKATQNYIETKVSPLLGFILSFSDNFFNLDVLDSSNLSLNSKTWKSDLWINLFKNNNIIKFNYELNMLSKEGKEISKFQCRSQWSISTFVNETEMMQTDASSTSLMHVLQPKLPFCWLLITTLSELYENFIELNRNRTTTEVDSTFEYEQYKTTISHLFEKTQFYAVIDLTIKESAKYEAEKGASKNVFAGQIENKIKNELFSDYIHDFILYNCKIKTQDDIELITKTIRNKYAKRYEGGEIDLKVSLPMVHYEYEKLRTKIDLYLKFVKLEPTIIKPLVNHFKTNENSNYIDIESCLLCMKNYKAMLGTDNRIDTIKNNLNELSIILQLTSSLLTQISNENDKDILKKKDEITEQYESLKVTQLFIENIMFINNSLLDLPSMCKDLTKSLSKEVNFFSLNTHKSLNVFMQTCIDHARGAIFNYKKNSKCCKKDCLEYYLIKDCNCKVCSDCMTNILNKHTSTCPICKKKVKEFSRVVDNKDLILIYDEFINKINGFYLNIQELIVFNENNKDKINESIINLLMDLFTESRYRMLEFAVKGNRSATVTAASLIFEFKPQFCSLLIQILYKNGKDPVKKYLDEWFKKQEAIYKEEFVPGNYTYFVDSVNRSSLYYINCVHDSLVQENNEQSMIKRVENVLSLLRVEIMGNANKYDAIACIFRDTYKKFDCKSLTKLAYLKYAILVFAEFVTNYKVLKMNQAKYDQELKLLEELNFELKGVVQKVYDVSKTVCYFLIKELIRKYGSSTIKELPQIPLFKWIVPDGLIRNDDKPADRYVLIGSKYTKCKMAIADCIGLNKPDGLVAFIKGHKENIFPYIYLGMYQQVALLYRKLNPTDIPIKLFENVLKETNPRERQQYWAPLLENEFTHNLKLKLNDSTANIHLDLAGLLIQFKVSVGMSNLKLMKPFIDLMQNPSKMKDAFLPTMQQDVTFDIQTALLQARGNDNPKFYACPNGHPYVLFDVSFLILKVKKVFQSNNFFISVVVLGLL